VPTVVGALGLAGVGHGVSSGIENVQKGNNYSAALDFGTAAFAALPFATKGGRNAMFGAQARARTAQTGSQVFNGAKNLGTQAWGGVKNLGAQGLSGVKNFGAQAFKGAQNLGGRALTSAQNLGIRAINSTKNAAYDVKDILSPQYATPEGMVFGTERPKDIPLIKNEPMRMQSNNPEGQLPQGVSSGKSSSPVNEPRVPNGDRPAVPTFKENPKGVAIPGKAEAKANAIAARKASRQPGYKPTEEDAFHIVADAHNRGNLRDKNNVITTTFDPKSRKWVIGQNSGTPDNLTPELNGWKSQVENQISTGNLKPHRKWNPGNCAEPNSLNNLAQGKPHNPEGVISYTFERKLTRVPGSSETEWRMAYKVPCRYCRTLKDILGVEMPQFGRIEKGNGVDDYKP
jgi:hypothetical protein